MYKYVVFLPEDEKDQSDQQSILTIKQPVQQQQQQQQQQHNNTASALPNWTVLAYPQFSIQNSISSFVSHSHNNITIIMYGNDDKRSASKAADAETGSISTTSSAASYVKSGQENKSSTRNGTQFSVQALKDKALMSQIKFA